jgi:hypothetical protein
VRWERNVDEEGSENLDEDQGDGRPSWKNIIGDILQDL